jgi:type IV secretion system protein VirB10
MLLRLFVPVVLAAGVAAAQPAAPANAEYTVAPGTKVPLSLINSISTKHSVEGDRVYLETAFPILVSGRIVIPVGSYVAGTVTEIKKPGRIKGKGEMYVRFDSLTLPNGVTREFRSRIGGMDGNSSGSLDRAEGRVESDGNRAGDARTIAETAGAGASVGAIAGSTSAHAGMGLGIGAAAGAAAGLIAVLATRGPDAVLAKGTTVEMVLDRALNFNQSEVDFGNYQPPRASGGSAPEAPKAQTSPISGRRWPY